MADTYESLHTQMTNQKLKFIDITNRLNNYNEIFSMNQHVSDMNKVELDKVNGFSETMKSNVLKLKQEYLLKDFAIKNYKFWANIMYFTIVVVGITLGLLAFYSLNPQLISSGLVLSITCVIAIIYIVILMFALSGKVTRRKYAWDQFYWKRMD
jgi:hypothetical protein